MYKKIIHVVPYIKSENNQAYKLKLMIGKVAQIVGLGYIPGKSTSVAGFSDLVKSGDIITVKEDNLILNGTRVISKNTFLIEAFLRQNITEIKILRDGIKARDFGELLKKNSSSKFEVLTGDDAQEMLSQVKQHNIASLLAITAKLSIAASLAYVVHRIAELLPQLGDLSLAGDILSAGMVLASSHLVLCSVARNSSILEGLKFEETNVADDIKARVKSSKGPPLTILIPSYNEPADVLFKTVFSSAMQNYRNKEIVVLLDDKPTSPTYQEIVELISKMNNLFSTYKQQIVDSLEKYKSTGDNAVFNQLIDSIIAEFAKINMLKSGDIVDTKIVDLLNSLRIDEHARQTITFQRYNDLLDIFSSPIKVFSRKKYSNVENQQLNKADNINAFMHYAHGKSLKETEFKGNTLLRTGQDDGLSFQKSKYITVIDADYRLYPPYALETVALLENDSKVAFVQTPQNFTAENPNPVESGAIVMNKGSWQVVNKGLGNQHQMYWGGTNSTLRVEALDGIKNEKNEIIVTDNITEDVATGINLMRNGWTSEFIARPLAVAEPVSDLSTHYTQYWRYGEGHVEATLKQTIPFMIENKEFRHSRTGFEYLMKGINPFYGFSLLYFSLMPVVSQFVPLASADQMALSFMTAYALTNIRCFGLVNKMVGHNSLEGLQSTVMMALHSLVFTDAVFSAIKNVITGTKAAFIRTDKDGERRMIPPKFLLPLVGIALLNAGAAANSIYNVDLMSSMWGVINSSAIAFGLAHFNGALNTFNDLIHGFMRKPPDNQADDSTNRQWRSAYLYFRDNVTKKE